MNAWPRTPLVDFHIGRPLQQQMLLGNVVGTETMAAITSELRSIMGAFSQYYRAVSFITNTGSMEWMFNKEDRVSYSIGLFSSTCNQQSRLSES